MLAGNEYELIVDIGPEDRNIYAAETTGLLEEVFLWKPGDRGTWVEIGVSGLGFDVLGSPLRQVWLPRTGVTQPVSFTVVPRDRPTASLRVSLYVRQNVVHVLRIGARVAKTLGDRTPHPAALARELDLPLEEVGQYQWIPRVEYSLGGDFANHAARALSIIANENHGRAKINIKGPDVWTEVDIASGDLPRMVQDVRDALTKIGTPPVNNVSSEKLLYGFGLAEPHLNDGTEEKLNEALQALATVGWRLFDLAVPGDARAGLRDALAKDDQVIHIAHVLLEKVVPWAVVYDREYDPNRKVDRQRNPVEHTACLAGLPDEKDKLPPFECGTGPECVLNPDRIAERRAQGLKSVMEETVACPRRFWGFRHQVELPPQQADQGSKPPPQANVADNSQPTTIAVGYHGGLGRAVEHVNRLRDKVAPEINAKVVAEHCLRDPVVDSLQDTELDAIYFYCHAEGQRETDQWPPALKFGNDDTSEERVFASELGEKRFTRSPLVVLNGCRTAGFSPDALSDFIRKFIRDKDAGALLGTEISVWEQLATEVGEAFLRSYLSGAYTAGKALLVIRRRLLRRYNPLGLVYTLYANADMQLAHPSTGQPVKSSSSASATDASVTGSSSEPVLAR